MLSRVEHEKKFYNFGAMWHISRSSDTAKKILQGKGLKDVPDLRKMGRQHQGLDWSKHRIVNGKKLAFF